ncbi:hypothetical protein FB451DRAFT_151563 [Mycena latifolia]|nr:hypothetical protein FB451DRAFT_151563 [Mycena latifolia]
MILHLNTKLEGRHADFFRANDHQCDFIVIISKVRPSTYRLGPVGDEDEDTDHDERAVVAKALTRTSSSTSSVSSSTPSSQEVDTLLRDPRIPSSSPATSPSKRPSPRPKDPNASSHHSRFSESVFKGRAFSDIQVLDHCWAGVSGGLFQKSPEEHMAYPKPGATTPRILRPYDVTYHPRCLDITFQELRFLGSDIGQAVRALNSTFGIPSDVHQALIEASVLCPVCSCQYSEDGFNDHIQLGACGNCPKPFAVASRPPPSRTIDLALRVLPDGKCLGNIAEFLDTPSVLLFWSGTQGWVYRRMCGRWRRRRSSNALNAILYVHFKDTSPTSIPLPMNVMIL